MNLTREWVEDYLGAFGFHVCTGPSVAYFEHADPAFIFPDTRLFTYEVISVGGIRAEGNSTGLVTTSAHRAVAEFLYELIKYVLAHGKPGDTVVWRRLPEMQERAYENLFDGGFDTYFTANARLTVVPGFVTSKELDEEFKENMKRWENERQASKATKTETPVAGNQPATDGVRSGQTEPSIGG